MIVTDLRIVLILLLSRGSRAATARTASQPPAGTPLPENETLLDPENRERSARTARGATTSETATYDPPQPNRTETNHPSEPNIETSHPSEPNTETNHPSEPNTETNHPSEPNRTETDYPLEPLRSGTNYPSEAIRSGTDYPSEPNWIDVLEPRRSGTRFNPQKSKRAETHSPSKLDRTETDAPSELFSTGTDMPSEPSRTETDSPLEPSGIETHSPSHLKSTKTHLPSEPNRTETDIPSEPNRTETDSPSEPNRTETDVPSKPNRTVTDIPSEPNRTDTDVPSEPNRTETDVPSEPNRTETDVPSKPNKTETDVPSEPNRTETDVPSEPNRTETDVPSEPNRTETDVPSEPNRTETDVPSEPNRTETDVPSEPNRTDGPSEPNRTETDVPSEPNRTETDIPSKPNRTETDVPSKPNKTETDVPSEPNRTETDVPSEPNRTDTDVPSEPNRTDGPSEARRGEGGLLFVTDKDTAQTVSEPDLIGRQNFYRWDSRTESDFSWTDGQTSSASGITPKSVTRRHISKRTPHTTYISSTLSDGGDISPVTNNTNVSLITDHPPTSTTHDLSTAMTGLTAEDSGNTTHQVSEDSGSSVTILRDSGNSTESSGINETDSGLSPSVTFPLQTPSYLMTTYPSPTSHQTSESSGPVTSVPVTAPNTTSDVHGTDNPPSESTFASTSPTSSSTFPASSSEPPSSPSDGAGMADHSSPNASSSSPIPSTLISSPSATFSTSPSEASPTVTSTSPPAPQTTLLTTSSLPSLPPSIPPSEPTTSSTGTSTSLRTSSPPASPELTSGPYNSPTSGFEDSRTTETAPRSGDGTSTTFIAATLRPDPETQTSETPPKDGGTQIIATTATPAQPTHLIPPTTSTNLPIASPRFTTQEAPRNIPEVTSPTLTTRGPDMQVTTVRTTSADIKVVTTISNKGKMIPARSTSQPGVVTTKPPTTTTTTVTIVTSPPTPPPPRPAPPRPTPPAPVRVCSPNPCQNGGSCTPRRGPQTGYKCECPAAWQGQHCDTDVDECLSKPCPALAECVNLRGSFTCRCPLGYILEKGSSCVQVRTFLGHIEIPRSFLNGSNGKYSKLQQIEEEIVQIMNSSFSVIGGYYHSSVTNSSLSHRIQLSVQNIFLLTSNVTIYDLRHHIQRYKRECQTSPERPPTCQLILHPQLYYIAVSLCHMRSPGCDNETSECSDSAGIAQCQCKTGYFKYSATDRSCRACDDGYKLQDGACVRCPFGLGGFNCSNPYQLITVIISAAGGGLLLILGVALAVTCCRKSKHDISKLIFKSGDFQMSPYAEYPKTQRSSEWGRETIEMQENGSTKNLLQMTDVYYSPALRNPELDRNGLYPYSGLPGSRHSCIYPGQYNPSFINEENRRRDYF